ncbi:MULTISPECIES: LysR family transcriptional regulator [Pseudomonas]|uniref:LysR family transcriptional regulator n=1 Tax=Pseudomonas fluorescens TaxID=294 RepID=A0A159ZVF7_PSEFL|nr:MULTISPECIES: LysR family transcriptional regulator [Pseudomonas]AMZ71014.1 LysR family transcriptional regulator [Pseudomonas fluorescens]SCZ19353.1 DNA-binding transcriptional regulator, LysR family [Pseudomonas sp. NFACC44-2]SDA46469.1 DNA-binding transcriptional regulator, LysR family [Pseudomonas sp. NFACC51]SEI43342.1 DNA-binding transcriptional regulator, LysR family [Pseudomonas sp. NFACC07-1]SFH03113.1 DNA-binding transcriptional regulator, LysR family [Pseudomonas sp. NFACC54]
MDRFQEMQVFMAVAEEEGFAAAARRLRISPPSVTRAIAAMEERIGTQLLSRTTRKVYLTEAGQRYLEDCRRILSELDEAEEAAAGSYSIPCGYLTVTAPVLFGELYIAPLLTDYLDQFPSVHLNALLVDRVVNIADEGIDVAIRIGHLQENNQHAIKVGEVRQVICGAPAYFQRHGRPTHPGELSKANIVMSSASHLLSHWQFMDEASSLSLRFDPRLVVTANQAAINIACQGWGVTRVLSYQVARQVADGELEVVLKAFEPPALPIHVVYQKSNRVPAKVRTFVDFLADRLGDDVTLKPVVKGLA